mmetsp:Transcript_15933/g.44076  ORF Transcript_15933/g.44076 Transcript_15933/m.44076 type:complete len:626 (+) Transcript_15933:247-2124(+)
MIDESKAEEKMVVQQGNECDDRSEVGSDDSEDVEDIFPKFDGESNVLLVNEDGDDDEDDEEEEEKEDDDDDSYFGTQAFATQSRRQSSEFRSKRLQMELNKFTVLASNQTEQKTDERIMNRVLKDVGSHGYGLLGVSVWRFDEEESYLVPSGWWLNPSMPKSKALDRLFDSSRADHVSQKTVAPGVDLAGLLWNEASENDMVLVARGPSLMSRLSSTRFSSTRFSNGSQLSRRSSFFMPKSSTDDRYQRSSGFTRSSIRQLFSPTTEEGEDEGLLWRERGVQWRDMKSLVNDPDTAKGPRLALLEEAGFHQAAGITFRNEIFQGIVLYYTGSDPDQETLESLANTQYLKQSAQMIGSCSAMVTARRATIGHKIKQGTSQTKTEKVDDSKEHDTRSKDRCALMPQSVKKLAKKVQGGGMQIPPAPNTSHAMWTVFGSLCGLLILSSLNQYYRYLSENELFLVLPPFGALMTLQFGLTAAPASQPRNAILGPAVAGAVSLVFTYIPESILAVWLRQAVAPAIAIGVMVKFGYTHPPAGAHAVLFASGKYNWALYGIVLLSTVISIVPAIFINNLSDKRQYPTYWFVVSERQQKFFNKTKKLLVSSRKTLRKSCSFSSSSSDNDQVSQ